MPRQSRPTREPQPLSEGHPSASTISESLWTRFFDGDRLACARIITRVENDPSVLPAVRDLLAHTSGLTYDFMVDTPVVASDCVRAVAISE